VKLVYALKIWELRIEINKIFVKDNSLEFLFSISIKAWTPDSNGSPNIKSKV
jgi:hypothetical protein